MKLKKLIVRPYATASLLSVADKPSGEASLLVSFAGGEVDLVVTDAEEVFSWRTVQMSPTDADSTEAGVIAAEIARGVIF